MARVNSVIRINPLSHSFDKPKPPLCIVRLNSSHIPTSRSLKNIHYPKPRTVGANSNNGSNALGANFRANKKHNVEFCSLYRQVCPSRTSLKNSYVMSPLPNLAGCAAILDQSTQVTLLLARLCGVSIESIVWI